MAETEGFEPSVGVYPYGGLANRWFQPLTHVSGQAPTRYRGAISKVQPGGFDSLGRDIDSPRRRFMDGKGSKALIRAEERLGEVPC